MKTNFNLPLWQVEKKYLAGKELTPREIQTAMQGLDSALFDEKVIACEALLRSPCSDATKDRVIGVVKHLCECIVQGEHEFQSTLVLVLLLLPKDRFIAEKAFQDFAFGAAKATDAGCRTNAMVVLERLARSGNHEAARLLQAAVNDPDDSVRQNARFFLDQLS